MKNNLFDFVKSAAKYSQETGDIVSLAYGLVNDMNSSRQKTAALVPETLAKLESLERPNGQAFVPDGFSKKATAVLNDHASTLTMLNRVLNEYGQLKEAYDKLVPSIGTVGTSKTAGVRNGYNSDGPRSNAMDKFRTLLLAEAGK